MNDEDLNNKNNYLSIGIVSGLLIGALIGVLVNNIAILAGLGMLIGIIIGVLTDKNTEKIKINTAKIIMLCILGIIFILLIPKIFKLLSS